MQETQGFMGFCRVTWGLIGLYRMTARNLGNFGLYSTIGVIRLYGFRRVL